jgi:LysM repeat protein
LADAVVARFAGAAGRGPAVCQKLVPTNNDPTIRFEYTPEPKDQGTKIVFIQIVQDFIDGVRVMPSDLGAGLAFKDKDTTAQGWCVDYVPGEQDPYYDGDDKGLDSGQQGNAVASPVIAATMKDTPGFSDVSFKAGKSKTLWKFRTAAFSADGADKGTYYQYQDWTYEKEKGHTSKLTVGTGGTDPGQDFKDAVDLWCKNHGFSLPTPPPPPPPPKPGQQVTTYVVVSGDYLSKIAQQFYGNANLWPQIYAANKGVIGANPNLIFPGQTLVIP